ncbi:hypothetical protein NM688_g2592 [Phlebia brevispora]|uniref:Uncharacterized protein n=1 Tax=Phlebia brevispora TaxID=194682 RepID=A0ACC1T819_9APHY|nr:hypothetical protein NM688_g2592 [Phlebia brevispora]
MSNNAEPSLPALEEFIESLCLSDGRAEVEGSGSTVKFGNMAKAGVYAIPNIHHANGPLSTYDVDNTNSHCRKIVTHLRDMQKTLSNVFSVNAPARIRIAVESKDTIELSQVTTQEDVAHAHLAIILRFVFNGIKLDKNTEYSPIEFDVAAQSESQPGGKRKSQRIKAKKMTFDLPIPSRTRPGATPEQRMETLRNIETWIRTLQLISEPDPEAEKSELTVQLLVGSTLRHIVKLTGTNVLNNRKMKYPKPTQMSLKDKSGETMPDMATVPIVDEAYVQTLNEPQRTVAQQLLQPIIHLGEAKRAATGVDVNATDNSPHYTVQMAMAVYPSLITLILLFLRGKKYTPSIKELPKDFFIFTYYYDHKRLILYAHFPYYRNAKRAHEKGWRFVQVEILDFELAKPDEDLGLSDENARKRLVFTIVSQIMRQHIKKLNALFTSKEYKDIVRDITVVEETLDSE